MLNLILHYFILNALVLTLSVNSMTTLYQNYKVFFLEELILTDYAQCSLLCFLSLVDLHCLDYFQGRLSLLQFWSWICLGFWLRRLTESWIGVSLTILHVSRRLTKFLLYWIRISLSLIQNKLEANLKASMLTDSVFVGNNQSYPKWANKS